MNTEKVEPKAFDRLNPAYRWRLWVHLDSLYGEFHHYFWRRISVVLAAIVVSGWFVATAGVWAHVKYHRGFSEARYVDLATPWRWGRYRAAIATHYLALGRVQLERGNPVDALNYLDAALALKPDNLQVRRMAALAEFRLGYKPASLALLRGGLAAAAAAGDQPFLQAFFDVAFDAKADDDAFATGSRLLPAKRDREAIHLFIALEMATARYNRGHYAEAERMLSDWGLLDFPEGEILSCQCEAARGRRGEALARLQGDLARFTHRDGIYVALERLAREQGLPATVRRYALLRGLDAPARADARIDLLYADQAIPGRADLRRDADSYCADLGSDSVALTLLSQFAADSGQPDMAERASALAAARGIRMDEFLLRTVQAGIVAHDYRRAIQAVAVAQAQGRAMGPPEDIALAGMKAVALFGAGDAGAELAFSDFFPHAASLTPVVGRFLADQLRDAGFARQSRQVLERVFPTDPGAPGPQRTPR